MLKSLLALSALSLASPAWARENLCATDLRPLVRVAEARRLVFHSLTLPPPPLAAEHYAVISKGGAVVGQRIEQELFDGGKVRQRLHAGRAAAARFDALRATLNSHQVGVQQSCFVANSFPLPTGVAIQGTFEITWHGRAGRTNAFTLTYGDPGQEGDLPLCSPQVQRLELAISDYLRTAPSNGNPCSSARPATP